MPDLNIAAIRAEQLRLQIEFAETLHEVMTALAPQIPAAGRLAKIIERRDELLSEIQTHGLKADYR